MKWIKANKRLPDKEGGYFTSIGGWKNRTFFNGNRFETGDWVKIESIEWMDETGYEDEILELKAENSGLRFANSELAFRNDKCNEHVAKLQQRISELESAFAGAEEMVKDKIKKISELEKAICLLTEVVDEQQQRLNNQR